MSRGSADERSAAPGGSGGAYSLPHKGGGGVMPATPIRSVHCCVRCRTTVLRQIAYDETWVRMAGLTWPVTVLPGFGGAFGPEERQFEPTVRRPSPLWAESGPGLCGCACQQAPAAAQVVGHGPEPDLQTGSGEPEPTHAPASAMRTSERSCQVANRSALNNASGGQPGSPLADAEMPARKRSISAQSIRAATASSDAPPRSSAPPSARCSCPI